ncbi:MAG: hypothetical protein ACQESR_21105 [Planctomycetota bacterium]
MPSTSNTVFEITSLPPARRKREQPELRVHREALDRATIAELPSQQVGRMSRSELARVVRASPIPPLRARLEYLDRSTLERLAHLACLSCRNRK